MINEQVKQQCIGYSNNVKLVKIVLQKYVIIFNVTERTPNNRISHVTIYQVCFDADERSQIIEIVNKTEVNLDGFSSKMVGNGNGNVINIPRIVNN